MTAFTNDLASSYQSAAQVQPELITSGDSYTSTGITQFDMIDQLIAQYRQREQALEETAVFLSNARAQGVMSYFIDGMALVYGPEYRANIPDNLDAAKASLRVEFWNRLLSQSQIFELMPAAKRKAARETFNGLECPPFDEDTVRPTLTDLFSQRAKFFAERVDGIFQGLSRDHVTNVPSGFSKKMIISNVVDEYGFVSTYKSEIISDLRGVVGRISGRGEPSEYGTRKLLARLRNHIGKKVAIDGGAFYVTVYKVGTVHFEVAPEVAIELNSILSTLYPLAIPSKFRTASKKRKVGSYGLTEQRLPMGVVDLLSAMERRGDGYGIYVHEQAKSAVEQTIKVLEDIGATTSVNSGTIYATFDYQPSGVIEQIIFSGSVPEKATYQFYPTKGEIGTAAAESLDIKPGLRYCEPSAGAGDLAQFLPKEDTICIEVAKLRAKVLEAKGYRTIQADFLQWATDNKNERFDRILMNPPFSKGRALAHLEAASDLLSIGGRLVAILPASMINTQPLIGFNHEWSDVYVDQFEDTAVRVAILTATHKS